MTNIMFKVCDGTSDTGEKKVGSQKLLVCRILEYLRTIVAKKRDSGILDPELFLAQIRKVEARLGKLAKIRKVETG